MTYRSTPRPLALIATVAALLFASLPTTGFSQPAHDLAGTWLGTLDVGATQLRVVVHFRQGDDGALEATMDSPDQGANGIPVGAVTLDGHALELQIPAIAGRYAGEISADGLSIAGHWSQGGASFPLTLERTESPPTVERPQEPQHPLPYREENVRFANPEANIELAGTLTLPEEPGRYPAVVLISGSGPQDRNESVFGHRPFLVLSDYLTRRGIAVLRYDDRGYGESTGDFSSATTVDFASDARAALEFLYAHDQIDTTFVGLLGHSEGGLVAPMAARDARESVDFLVLLAAPAVTGEAILYQQDSLIAQAGGASDALIRQSRHRAEQIYGVLNSEPDPYLAATKLDSTIQALGFTDDERAQFEASGMDLEAVVRQQVAMMNTPWFRFFLSYDPLPALEEASVPILALTGSKDLQVPAAQSIPLMEHALDRPGQEASMVRVLPDLNHMFQRAETGHPNEYARIEHTFDPEALEIIADWILALTNEPSRP